MSRAPLVFLVTVIAVSIVAPCLIVSQGVFFPLELTDLLYAIGKTLGLVGFFVLSFQYLWTAKFRFLERLRSYDGRVAVHRTMGFLGILAIALHPVLILASYAAWGMGLDISVAMGLGFLALLLLLLIVGSTFLSRIWGVRYNQWKKLHWFTFPVLTLVFFHSIVLGGDLYGIARYVWIALWGLHLVVLVSKTIHKLRAWFSSARVMSVSRPAPGITSLTIEKPKGSYLPGQFAFISLKMDGRWESWHPFSLTSNPSEDHLSMTIKGLGDFTGRIQGVKAGDPIKIDAAYGSFSPRAFPDRRYVMIAAGVGLTPIYGVLKDLRRHSNPPDVILLYCVHHESDILFKQDLDQWFEARQNWQLVYICTSQPDWGGESGRMTPERVLPLCNLSLEGTFFLCGPAAMVAAISRYLRSQGIPRSRIRQEQFVFLP